MQMAMPRLKENDVCYFILFYSIHQSKTWSGVPVNEKGDLPH